MILYTDDDNIYFYGNYWDLNGNCTLNSELDYSIKNDCLRKVAAMDFPKVEPIYEALATDFSEERIKAEAAMDFSKDELSPMDYLRRKVETTDFSQEFVRDFLELDSSDIQEDLGPSRK